MSSIASQLAKNLLFCGPRGLDYCCSHEALREKYSKLLTGFWLRFDETGANSHYISDTAIWIPQAFG